MFEPGVIIWRQNPPSRVSGWAELSNWISWVAGGPYLPHRHSSWAWPVFLAGPASRGSRQFFLGPLRRGGRRAEFTYDFFAQFGSVVFVLEMFSVLDGNFSMIFGRFRLCLEVLFQGPGMQELSTSVWGRKMGVKRCRMSY